ncbi:hypothetical protein [Pseudoalteromonas rubra]|uniref:hypothetical protein n=1 Tax=Pseudoalteromonas rubra TaxID=43658 RepID=UPI0014873689|nr:hypothetical protein [Pseudoalteromonas rubra]
MKILLKKKSLKALTHQAIINKNLTADVVGGGLPNPHTAHAGDCQPHTDCGNC